jgi:glycosyltransferase involved in cell wall biosynthesis
MGAGRPFAGVSDRVSCLPTLLSINNYYYYRGGAERVFLQQNQLFRDLGWEVVPFCMTHKNNIDTPWSRYFVDELELGEGYSPAQKLIRAAKVIYSFEARRKLARVLDETEPAACHAHNIYHHISPSILGLLKRRAIPVVLTLHDLKIACPAYNMLASDGICERCRHARIYNVLTHRCIKGSVALSAVVMIEALVHNLLRSYRACVSRFVVPSRFYISKLSAWGLPPSMFRHVPNFVRPECYAPQYPPGDGFLYFGRLSREKGLATLIRAAAMTQSRVLIAGTGPQLDELRRIALQLQANVEFIGYLAGDRLHSVIRGARAVVLPSEWYENAPMSVLEGYALGKPVIGARIGGIPELLREGETGLGCESANADSLAVALRAMSDLPDRRIEDMGRAARRWVESEFTAVLYRDRICDLYRELHVPMSGTPASSCVPRSTP